MWKSSAVRRIKNKLAPHLALTSDYLVRGITRSNNHGAAQGEIYYVSSNGLSAGLFASNTQFTNERGVDAELSAFFALGFDVVPQWRAQAMVSHYAYPNDPAGSRYNYDEVEAQLGFSEWLTVVLNYSPNSPRFILLPYADLVSVAEKSIELNLQHRLLRTLSAIGGVGCAHWNGPRAASYLYFSLGAAYDLGPLSFTLSFTDTSHAAKSLFYNDAATGRLTGTVIWRF